MPIDKDENSIVLIKRKNQIYWFAAFKTCWVLDRINWVNDFIKHGVFGVKTYDHQERYHLPIVNEDNADNFMSLLINDGYLIDKDVLSDEFYRRLSPDTTWWDIHDLMPDLFIDFDTRTLYAQFVENMHYERYVPEGWSGTIIDFCSSGLLPPSEMFWVKGDKDHRQRIIAKG
ncbi:Group-specific protein [Kosakonia sp. BK9b]